MNNDQEIHGSGGNGVTALTKEQLEGLTIPIEAAPALFCYSLVLAEVVFSTNKGISSLRCQLFSKSDVLTFPAARLSQLQNSAAHQVQGQVNGKDFKAIEVIILNILPLGWMTDEEFWGSKANIPGAAEQALSINPDNVVPLHRT